MPENISDLLQRLGGSRGLFLLLVGVATTAAVWSFARWGSAPTWVPVATGLPLEQVGQATQRLEEAGIDFRLERSGAVVAVQDGDVARARVTLAAEGLTGSSPQPGFELFDQPSWGMTDFTQRVNYRRALEGELERTISAMKGVRSARVHLALQEASVLRRGEEAGEASVVLDLRSVGRAEAGVVEGIQALVAGAVDGIEPGAVTVLDAQGRLLSESADGMALGMTASQLRVQRQIEEYLERKAESVVQQIVGPGAATVRVAAALNFDRLDRTVQAVNPDQQLLVSEDRAEITPGDPSQGAGSVTTNAVYEATRSVETYSRAGARIERLTVAVVLSDRRVENASGSAAFEPRSAEELDRVESLVANAVGIMPERGDAITVASAPAEPVPLPVVDEPGMDVVGLIQQTQRPLISLLGLAVALFLALRIVAAIKETAPPRTRPALAGAPAELQLPAPPASPSSEMASAAGRVEAPPEPPTHIVDPMMTAKVVRSWLKES